MAEPPTLSCSRRQTLIMLVMLLLLCLLIFSTSIAAANDSEAEDAGGGASEDNNDGEKLENCTAFGGGSSACVASGNGTGERWHSESATGEESWVNRTEKKEQTSNDSSVDRVPFVTVSFADFLNNSGDSEHPFRLIKSEVVHLSAINATQTPSLTSYTEEQNFEIATDGDRAVQELILEEYNTHTKAELFSSNTSSSETHPGHPLLFDHLVDSSYLQNSGNQNGIWKRSVVSVRAGRVCGNTSTCDRDGNFSHSFRLACHCDPFCDLYGDCCALTQDPSEPTPPPAGVPLSLLQTPVSDRWTCKPLHVSKPSFNVYMVKFCPAGSSLLAERCGGRPGPQQNYSYILDVPVVSSLTGIVYANYYCALCHLDGDHLEQFQIDLFCSEESLVNEIEGMEYHPGELLWTKELTTGDNTITSQCTLDVIYGDEVGRLCEEDVVTTCASSRGRSRPCPPYTYYVMGTSDGRVYLNSECALCNGIVQDDILCFPIAMLRTSFGNPFPPSLSDLFTVNGGCPKDQLWDPLYRRCEDIACGHLFVLQDGECVRNDEKIPETEEPFLNSSCSTSSFPRDFGKVYPNGSLFLNATELLYSKTEYEFAEDGRIRVCRPPDRWTPTMNIISTVLISISLVGMILHIVIFLLLPKRRNIPGMNLFSMTCSLFIAEIFFVSLFNKNENRAACIAIALVIYYFLSASFLWMNVMSIDIFRTFHSHTYKAKSRKIFILYSVYAWTVPLASSLFAIMLDQFAKTSVISPNFGTDMCWFNNKWALATFFTFPAGFVVVVNMILYGLSVYDIYKQHKSGELAASTVRKGDFDSKDSQKIMEKEKFLNPVYLSGQETSKESPGYADRLKERIQRSIKNNKKQSIRLILYSKLAIIMGMTWIFAFISIHTKSLVFEYLFIVLNGLQGTFIFIAFDCKWKVWYDLRERFTGKVYKPSTAVTSSTASRTQQTSLMSSSSSSYRNSSRWSRPLHTNISERRVSNRLSKNNADDSEGEESSCA